MDTQFAPFATMIARQRPQRVWSVLVTVMGDAVLPRGGEVSLGALQEIAGALGVEAGAVRTALSRLAADGLITRRRNGTASFVSLSERAAAEFAAASAVIYAGERGEWAGTWTIAETGEGGVVAPGVVLRPVGRRPGEPAPDHATIVAGRAVAAKAWPLVEAAEHWGAFAADARACAASAHGLSGLDAIAARIAVVHRYRRIVLKAPDLPGELLPDDWPGDLARRLVADIYAALLAPSERWLDLHARRADGPLPPAEPTLARRFGPLVNVTKRVDKRSIL